MLFALSDLCRNQRRLGDNKEDEEYSNHSDFFIDFHSFWISVYSFRKDRKSRFLGEPDTFGFG